MFLICGHKLATCLEGLFIIVNVTESKYGLFRTLDNYINLNPIALIAKPRGETFCFLLLTCQLTRKNGSRFRFEKLIVLNVTIASYP